MIGQWVARYSKLLFPATTAHLVESEVAERVVTRCGRQMALNGTRGILAKADGYVPRCAQCVGRAE